MKKPLISSCLFLSLLFSGCDVGNVSNIDDTNTTSTTLKTNTKTPNTKTTTHTTSTKQGGVVKPNQKPKPKTKTPDINTTNYSAKISMQNIFDYQSSGNNLISNGSFELGFGIEPIYIGWKQRQFSTDMTPPSLPIIDSTTASSGNNSLKIGNILHNHIVTIDFTPKDISKSGAKAINIGISAKSNCSNVYIHFPTTDKFLTNQWQRYNLSVAVSRPEYPVVRLEIYNNSNNSCKVWLDDVTWTLDNSAQDGWVAKDIVESAFLFDVADDNNVDKWMRKGVYFDDKDIKLRYKLQSGQNYNNIGTELHLRDLSRGGVEQILYHKDFSLQKNKISGDTIDIKHLKKGAYMAHLVIYDKSDNTILGVAQERFSVMSNLENIPPLVDFVVGMHGGFHAFTHSREFNYRGAWDGDDYYQMAYEIGLRAQRIFASVSELVPNKGVYNLDILRPTINYAAKNGCTTMLSVDPFVHKPKTATAPSGHDGDWLFSDGKDVTQHANSSLNIYVLHDDEMKRLFGDIAKEFGDKLIGLENTNELNMYYHPDNLNYAVEDLFKPMYSEFHKYAPNVPVLVDFTMDFFGVNYTEKFFKHGGLNYADGFTYHPYGREWVFYKDGYGEHYGIKFMQRNEKYRADNSINGKKLVMGMSEVHSVGVYNAVGWGVMQRTLLDWSGGAKFSSGMLSGGLYFLETRYGGEWSDRSTTAPGIGAVALNAMYGLLGGYKLVKRIELNDGVLIVLFKDTKTSTYCAALTQGNYRNKRAVVDIKIPNDAKFYDQWGEIVKKPTQIKLNDEILYIKSSDKEFENILQNGSIGWVNENYGYDYSNKPIREFSPSPTDAWYAKLLKTGLRPHN